jgi:hypothetical protein
MGEDIYRGQRLGQLDRTTHDRENHAGSDRHVAAVRKHRGKSRRRIEPRTMGDQVIVRRQGFEAQVPSGLHICRQPLQRKPPESEVNDGEMYAVIQIRLQYTRLGSVSVIAVMVRRGRRRVRTHRRAPLGIYSRVLQLSVRIQVALVEHPDGVHRPATFNTLLLISHSHLPKAAAPLKRIALKLGGNQVADKSRQERLG